MKKVLLVLFLGFYFLNVNSQIVRQDKSNGLYKNDTTSFNKEVEIQLDGVTKYTDYKIISFNRDTTVIDTTLTLKKDFKFNYLRKDNFELLAFHNQGQTFNKLGYNFTNKSLLPSIGASAKHYNYLQVEDISYYEVPTPTSEIFYRTGLEQGQALNAFLTMNTSRQFNLSLAYKGLRSLGKYRNSLSSHGNFRTTFNYHSKNKKYYLRGHFSSFDLLNNENGGLPETSIAYFENNDPNYIDRGRLDVNYTDANNMFEGKRYYIDQQATLFSKKNKIEEHNKEIDSKIKRYNAVIKKIEGLKNDSISAPKNLSAKSVSKAKKKSIKKQKDSIVQLDSIKVNNIAKIDSLAIKESSVKLDSIKKINSIKIDSLIKKEPLIKKDSISKLDSIYNDYHIKIDSLKMLAATIKTDSTQFIPLKDKRYFDSKIGHSFMYETQHYRFRQDASNAIFGDAFNTGNIVDHTSYQKLDNQIYLQLFSPYTGTLKAKINYYNYNYHYNSVLYYNENTINDKIKGNAIVAGAEWKTQFGKVYLNADASSIISGDITGSALKASAMVKKDSVFSVNSFAEFTSKTPEFNTLLYQSDYKEYNWQNDFKNEEISTIGVEFSSTKWGSLRATYHLIDNFTYFNENSKPVQANETLNYVKVKASKAITYRKFTLDNTVMYQNVLKGESFFRVPQIVTRNSLYFSSYVFKGKPMFLQTGVTAKYFTAFKANAYNPLLSEFVLQDEAEIGNFPMVDFFINAQIQRTRIFLKVENLNASFTGRTYYSAPNYPYRDLTVRFGVVWNWFI